MYSIFTTIAAAMVVAFAATSITVSPAPAQETASISNIPPMYEINWGTNEPLSPEADHALHTFYVCEYSDQGHAAMEELLDTLGTLSFTGGSSERIARAETMYGLAERFEREGACRWSDHLQEYFLYGSGYNVGDEYDLTKVPCTTLPNGICASIQPMRNVWNAGETGVVYSLFTDTHDDLLYKEFGEQWLLVH